MTDTPTTFGERLKCFLNTHTLSAAQAIAKTNIGKSSFYRYLNDTGGLPEMRNILRLQQAFPSLNIQWLFTGLGPMEWAIDRETLPANHFFTLADWVRRFEDTLQLYEDLNPAGRAVLLTPAYALVEELLQESRRLATQIDAWEEQLHLVYGS